MKKSCKKLISGFIKPLSGCVLLPILLASSVAVADDEAVELLNRMNHALHQLNYKGDLAYLRGDSLSTLQIEHSVVNGVESERVVRLNEGGSEVSRELKGFSLASIPRIRPKMEEVYSFDMGRENRIANIPCRIITARPKDRERYLQKYCIDSVTGMLLDYMLVGKSHKPVEQFMFTTIDIKVPEEVSLGATNANKTTAILGQGSTPLTEAKTTVVVPQKSEELFRQITSTTLEDGWVMDALPAGYEISQAPHMKDTDNGAGVTKHYIVSDGLSSLSVFVAPLTEQISAKAVKINSGALNMVTQKKGSYMITVVGEVPEVTLKNIVKNLRKK